MKEIVPDTKNSTPNTKNAIKFNEIYSLCNTCPCFNIGEESDSSCGLKFKINFTFCDKEAAIDFSKNCKLKVIVFGNKIFEPEKFKFSKE